MPQSPYAKVLMSIAGAGNVSGGQIMAGGQTLQLSGENTSHWENQLWEIYEYPDGFTLPSGWTDINGVYQNNDLVPDVINIPTSPWGKYLFRLTVDGGLLDGVYAGPDAVQPLIDIASGVHVLGVRGTYDVAWQELNQFDSVRQSIGELKKSLRLLDSGRMANTRSSQQPYPFEIQTAAVTQVNCGTYTMANESFALFETVTTIARRTNVTKAGAFRRAVAYRRTGGGVPTIVGALETIGTDKNTTAGSVTIDQDGVDTVRVRVTPTDTDPRNITTFMTVTEMLAT